MGSLKPGKEFGYAVKWDIKVLLLIHITQ